MNRYDEFRANVIDNGYGFMHSTILQAAFRLGIFEVLQTDAKTPSTMAGELKVDLRALELFLNALAALNFIRKTGNAYGLTEVGKHVFLEQSEKYVGDIVKHHRMMACDFLELAECVRAGKPVGALEKRMCSQPEHTTREFICAMHNTAMGHAEVLARKIDLSGARFLLDVGGGSGAFSIQFLKQNPNLHATVFDLPATLEVTKEFVERYGMSTRVEFQPGDFEENEFKGVFDVVFMSHIIHSYGEEANERLFRKIYGALNAGGCLIVQDFFLNEDKVSPQFPALFALNMLLHTESGRSYTHEETKRWMSKAGFGKIERPAFRLPRGISLLFGWK